MKGIVKPPVALIDDLVHFYVLHRGAVLSGTGTERGSEMHL